MPYTEETKIGVLWSSPETRAVLLRHLPGLSRSPQLQVLKGLSLRRFAGLGPGAWLTPLLTDLAPLTSAAEAGEADERDDDVDAGENYELTSVARGSAPVRAAGTVDRWGVFEIELAGPRHGNPFTDVSLAAAFSCGERAVDAEGFYDGDGVYRIRFMPATEGVWTYRTRSNARSLDGIQGHVNCGPPVDGNHGPVRVADTFHFAYDDGMRYRPFGTTCYAWTHQGDALEKQTLATLAAGPFNKVRMCVFPKSYQFNENEPSFFPFEGSAEQGWDFTRFSPEFFRHLEGRIADLAALGIEADVILFHPYDRWGFAEMSSRADNRYLRYVAARLAAFRNVWWSLANEYDLMWSKDDDDWERFARIICASDPYRHLISVHNCFEFYDYSKPWVTHGSLQRIDIYRTAENTDEWRRRWKKPIVIDECGYEGDIELGWGNITGEEMVRRCWEGALRGGYVGHGETYLHPDDILWWSKGGELHGTSPARIAFLRTILEEGPSAGLDPMPEWDAPCAGGADYRLYYYGFNQPRYRHFTMPPGVAYRIDVIDTWNMTIDEQEGTVEGNFRVDLPGRPYMAIRVKPAE